MPHDTLVRFRVKKFESGNSMKCNDLRALRFRLNALGTRYACIAVVGVRSWPASHVGHLQERRQLGVAGVFVFWLDDKAFTTG